MADAMDSKSISLTGVGVQVPASAPTSAHDPSRDRAALDQARDVGALDQARDDLVPAMVAVLVHKLANTTQYLGALNTLLSIEPDASAHASSMRGLGATATEVDELGWALGLLANACGADLLLERREREGLASFLRIVGDCTRREGRAIVVDPSTMPTLTVRDRDDWRVPWAIGRFLFGVARTLPSGTELRAAFDSDGDSDGGRLVAFANACPDIAALRGALTRFDARLDVEIGADRCVLRWAARAPRTRAT